MIYHRDNGFFCFNCWYNYLNNKNSVNKQEILLLGQNLNRNNIILLFVAERYLSEHAIVNYKSNKPL